MTRAAPLIVALSLLLSTPAAAQSLGALLRADSVRWRDWEAPGPRPNRAALERLGVCRPMLEESLAVQSFRYVDVDADGRTDLVYSGPGIYCNAAIEGERTVVLLSRGARLVEAMSANGRVVAMWRLVPWEAPVLLLRIDGCCADPNVRFAFRVPRLAGDTLRYEEVRTVVHTYQTVVPDRFLARPRPFAVAQDGYNLRAAPVVDDADDENLAHPGNVMARLRRGSRGVALAERTGADGRAWWFVLLEGGNDDAYARWAAETGDRPPLLLGWMSARFLEPVADTLPRGRVPEGVFTLPGVGGEQ